MLIRTQLIYITVLFSKAKVSIILDTYYNITEIQANYYIKTEIDSLFSNIDFSNYYTKLEIDDIDNSYLR